MNTIPAALGLVTDAKTGRRCLLDSGSQVSLWPASMNCTSLRSTRLRLIAANGSAIKTFGTAKRKIQIGDQCYSFSFIIAEVTRPILGIDFLQRYKIAIDFEHGQLLHSRRATPFSSASRERVSGVNVVRDFRYESEQLLRQYPEITDVARATR